MLDYQLFRHFLLAFRIVVTAYDIKLSWYYIVLKFGKFKLGNCSPCMALESMTLSFR